MSKRRSWIGAWGVLAWLVVAAPAQAQQPQEMGPLRIGGFIGGGFGGEADVDPNVPLFGDPELEPTATLGIIADYPIFTYVAVGLLARASFLHVDGIEDNASTALDISAMLRARYPFQHGEVYFAVPVGYSHLWVNDDLDVLGDIGSGPGWNVAILAGGQYNVTDDLGLFGHLGGQFRGTNHDNVNADITTKQFVIEIGAAYLL